MRDHFTSTNDEFRPQDEQYRNLVNARLGFRKNNWHVELWGKNLTEDVYAQLTAATLPLTGVDARSVARRVAQEGTSRWESYQVEERL